MRNDREPIPSDVRAAVLRRANGCCEDCGQVLPLELHHLRYETDGNPQYAAPIFGRETPSDLEALCRHCHLQRHLGPFGQFYVDPEEAKAERDHFEFIMTKPD